MSAWTPINAVPVHPAWAAESQQSGQGSAAYSENEVLENGLIDGPANSDVESDFEEEGDEHAAAAQTYHQLVHPDDWEKTTTEINSISSEVLHETRPNRWKELPSTWRKWTKNDREAWRSIEGVRMNDLGVHLYNAFVLRRDAKRRIEEEKAEKGKGKVPAKGKGKATTTKGKGKGKEGEVPSSAQGEAEEDGQYGNVDGSGSTWYPAKSWTAWPAYERGYERLGDGEIVNGLLSVMGRVDGRLPGDNLREEIGASILRAAKKRFHRRQEKRKRIEEEGAEDAMETEQPPPAKRQRSPSYELALRADDEINYNMVRPFAAQIMEKLDDTLRLLHNSRVATMRLNAGDNAADGGAKSGADTEAEQTTPKQPASRSKKGTKGTPQAERPTTPGGDTDMQETEADTSTAKKKRPRSRSRAGSAGPSPAPATLKKHHYKLMQKLALRDWRDVITAAGMAGFEPDVIARAAQRCATLFQQDITLTTLPEVPLTGSHRAGAETVRYTPGNLAAGREESDLSSGEEDDEEEEEEGEEEVEEEDGEEAEEEETEYPMDAMDGSVHVDGFLQPIIFSDDDAETEDSGLEEASENEEEEEEESPRGNTDVDAGNRGAARNGGQEDESSLVYSSD